MRAIEKYSNELKKAVYKMKKVWRLFLVTYFALSLLLTMPRITAFASDGSDEDIVDEHIVEDGLNVFNEAEEVCVTEEMMFETESDMTSPDNIGEEESQVIQADNSDLADDVVGASNIAIASGLTATWDSYAGSVVFYSDGGTLPRNWTSRFGKNSIKSVKVASGKVYLPANSSDLFADCEKLVNLDLAKFDSSRVTDMSWMFAGCRSLASLDLRSFSTTNVKDMRGMFDSCTNLSQLNLSSFNTCNTTNMSTMFAGCCALTKLDLGNFNTGRVTDMNSMFAGCTQLKTLNLSSFNTANVVNMSSMFYVCYDLREVNLQSFNTSKVTNMYYMFGHNEQLVTLDLHSFNTSKVTSMDNMLKGCNGLKVLKTPYSNRVNGIELPKTMYSSTGTRYTSLPVLSKSIVLATTQKTAQDYEKTAKRFSDVQDPSHPFYKAIYWAANAGITKGYPDGTFGINRSCTRGEMMMFLWRYAGNPSPKAGSKSPFKDVAKNHAFYKAILWGSQKGITKGYPDGTFGVNRNVSRGECMMFLWRLKGKPSPKAVSASPFKDVSMSHAFYNAILWGYQKKITTGYTSGTKKGTFGINENCTRGAIVTFLYRAR